MTISERIDRNLAILRETALTAEERRACEVAAIAAPGEVRGLLDIIERLTGEKFEDRT